MERGEFLRAAWRVTVAEEINACRLVFVNEMGTNTSFPPFYAWASKAERAYCSVPRNRGPNMTLLSSMSADGTIACRGGATNREVFESYVEQILAPTLRLAQVVVMDNLTAHKGERIRELIEHRGCELLYLAPYSPEFNPIE